jgi:anti-sigma factor RsiW
MIDHITPVTEDELHAYVDGELPQERRLAVETWLASHPEDAAQVAAWRAQAEAIQARFGGVIDEPIPQRLQLDRLTNSRTALTWIGMAAASVLVAFLAGGIAGWMARGASAAAPDPAGTLTATALQAHKLYVVEVRHPVEVPGGERAHLVTWLSKRLGYELRLPDLGKTGLKLVGGRLLPGPNGKPAAFFMYENASGERFTLYCMRAPIAQAAMHYTDVGTVAGVRWVDRYLAYVLSGPDDHDRLLGLAKTAYDDLDTHTGAPG